MHASKADLEPQRLDEYEGRWTDDGDLRFAFESMPAQFPPDPSVFAGLPGDRCQCPHHGYVISGSFRVDYPDGSEEIVRAGDVYNLYPGHFVQSIEPVELVEFSPRAEHDVTMTAVARNLGLGAAAG